MNSPRPPRARTLLTQLAVIAIFLMVGVQVTPAHATQWYSVTPAPATAAPQPTPPPTFQPAQATPAPTPSLPDGAIGTIVVTNSQSVRVRAGSNQNTAQIGLINPGERYYCVGVADNGWFEIIYPTGQNGFVSNKLVRLDAGHFEGQTLSYIIGYVQAINDEPSRRTTNGASTYTDYMGYADAGRTYPCVGVMSNGWYAILREENGFIVYLPPAGGMWVDK